MFAGTAEKRFGALGRMGLVAALHVAALFVIARSLGIVPGIPEADPIVATAVDDPRPIEKTPPIAPPVIDDLRVWVPQPDVPIIDQDIPLPPDIIIGSILPPPGGEIEGGSTEPHPSIEAVRLDARHPLAQPPYPMARIRNNDEGAVDLEVYVLPNGRVGDARVRKTSGFEDFDRAALQEARRSWRLTPATRDGVPFAQWYALRVVFKLKNQQ
jgi:protein TonB